MKSEFNKNSCKVEKNSDDNEECENGETTDADNESPPELKAEINTEAQTETSDTEASPPKITESDTASKTSDSSTSPESKSKQSPSKVTRSPVRNKSNNVDSKISIKEETQTTEATADETSADSENKPRIVLTFRTEKLKSTVTSSYPATENENGPEESTSPGRRSLRIKTNSIDEKDKKTEVESGLKRSARRRSKDCTESILQSAIARKEKSYNETARPQRLTRRLKPTAKILANLEMCQKNAAMKKQTDGKGKSSSTKHSPVNERQRFSYDKLDKGSEQALIESETDYSKPEEPPTKISEQLHRKFKRKHKHKTSKTVVKKSKTIKLEGTQASDSDSSSRSSHQDAEADSESVHEDKSVKAEVKRSPRKSSSESDIVKPFRRSHRKSGRAQEILDQNDTGEIYEPLSGSIADEESLVPAHPESTLVIGVESTAVRKCLCQHTSQIYITTSNLSDVVYCTAMDSVNNRIIGCNNVVSGELAMLRPSTRVPYIILCEVHKQRLLRHNCCPTCGLFCTQGRFTQCPANHQYHRDCQIIVADGNYCPHCGLATPKYDVEIVMKCAKKPVFLPTQKCHYPSAKMSFQAKTSEKENICPEKRSASPPLIPVDAFDVPKPATTTANDREKVDILVLFDAVKTNDCEKVAAILGSCDVNLSELIPGSDGITVLHYASREGLLAIVHMLLVAGAEHDVLDKEQNTPLMLAIQAFKNTVVKYLIKSGASITLKGTDGMSALHLAAKHGNLEACGFLLSSTSARLSYINSVDDGGWTPLVWACEHGYINVTRYLLQNGADPLLRDVEQNVALHWGAFSGSSQITEMLLNHGCEVNAVNAHGDSPLHVAARQDKYNCVLMLLARGANVHLVNKSEETPLDCCMSKPGDCYTAISLNVQLQAVTESSTQRKQSILTNDISRGKEINPVQCINTFDNEQKPTDFVYVTENCTTSDINIDRKITTLQSCQCEDRCTSSECLCSNNSLRCWYDDEGRLSADFNYADPPMLFECNPACSCNAITCNNRVVQHGLTQRFQLFRTLNKGWGIRTLRLIPRGAYVCEYVGEIISDLEADQREDDSYLFDLDNRDLRFPRIAFFANRDIQADEELGFDYGEKFWIIKYKSFTCTCGYPMCRYSESTIKTTLESYQRRLVEEQESVQEV
ncbi:G9a [Carabus blaptoides fortunei]